MNKHTVKEILKTVGPLPFKTIGKWLIQICNALKAEIEGRGTESFIPLCPSLLNVTDEMDIVYDAGSYIFHPPEKHSQIAPPAYWSPEQAKDAPLTIQSTLYSLGVVTFEMTTGRLPFSSDTSKADILLAHMRVQPPKASSMRFDVPLQLESLIEKLLSKESGNRFNSLDDVASSAATIPSNEDSTGIKAQKMLEGIFTKKMAPVKAPQFSIQTRVNKSVDGGALSDPEANRATVRMKVPVFNGPPEWEKTLKVRAHTGKVTLIWTTENPSTYSCKIARRETGAVVSHISENEVSKDHKIEIGGLEPGTSYSATIFNETDFVMRNFKTPIALV